MTLQLKIFCCAAILAFIAGCGNENIPADRPIRFQINFSETSYSRAATDAGFNCTWEEGDRVGIFAVRRQSGAIAALQQSGNYIHNAGLTYNGGTWTPDSGTELMFPPGGDLLDFYAYYPYDDNGGSPQALNPAAIPFTVKINQAGETESGGTSISNFSLSDLLSAVSAGVARTNEPVILTFSHALSLVQVDISDREANVPEYMADKLTVTLKGVATAAVLNLGAEDGPAAILAENGNDPQEIVMARVKDAGEGRWVYRALVPAQTVPVGVLFRFEQETDGVPGVSAPDEFSLEYKTADAKQLEAGSAAKYEITLAAE